MSVTTSCPEGITGETLSAWGDGGLPEAEATRLQAHVAACPACQERLRAHSEVGRLVRGQRVPVAPPVDIAAVRAGQRPQHAARHVGRGRLPRAVWGGLGAVVAAALLIAAFSQVFAHLGHITPATTATPAGTATPAATKLTWSQRTLPPGVSLAQDGLEFAVSPATSQNAWACAPASQGTFTIWASTDQARSWHVVSHLTPPASTPPINSCYLTADQGNPQTVAIGLAWTCEQCVTLGRAVNYVSNDGGATWHVLPGKSAVLALATTGSRTYAGLFNVSASRFDSTSASASPILEVSDNGLRDWRDIMPAGAIGRIQFLWPDPVSGALLASDAVNHLWRTNDGGANWSETTFPNNGHVLYGVWLPTARHWRVCGIIPNTDPTTYCSDDQGKTWTTYPPLSLSVTCRDCGKGGGSLVSTMTCPPDAVALDGSLLTLCKPGATTAKGPSPTVSVYRLSPGATDWRSLGPIPGSIVGSSAQVIGGLTVTGDPSSSAGAIWIIDPSRFVVAVAVLPS